MPIIRNFINLLEKQGLQHGRLVCQLKEYIYSKDEGIQEVGHGTGIRVISEPESIKEEMEIGPGKEISFIEKKRRQSRILYRLFFVLLFVVVGLFLGVIYLNNKMSQREIDPSQVLEIAGEKPVSTKLSSTSQKKPEGEKDKKSNGILETEKKDPVEEIQQFKKPEAGIDQQVEPKKNFQGSVAIRDIAPDLIAEYNLKMKTLRVDLPRKVKASGYFHVSLFIDDAGRISLFQFQDSETIIQPESKRDRVLLRIKQMISGLQFRPPKDKSGQAVNVENWKLKYQVTQFKQRMILRMR